MKALIASLRHSRESGNPVVFRWILAFAYMGTNAGKTVTIIQSFLIFLSSLFLSGTMYAEDLGEEIHDSCRPLDGFYSYIGKENEWGNKGKRGSVVAKPKLPSIAFNAIPYLGTIDGVRIRHERENSALHVEVLGKILDRFPRVPTQFSVKYDDCINGKVVFKEYSQHNQDGSSYKSNGTTILWLDEDKSLIVYNVFDIEAIHFFIFKTRRHVEGSYTFRWLIDKSADRK